MPALILLILVTCGIVVGLANWRAGLLFCIVIGMLQDPIRKVTAGTPPYLTLAFVPIYFAMLVALWRTRDVMSEVRRYYPQILIPGLLFTLTLMASAAQTVSYGLHAVPVALLGLFSYAGGLPALFLGFFFLRRDFTELDRPMIVFVALTSLMLVGVPLEYWGHKFSDPWLGTIATNQVWRRWYSSTEWVEMISGFHRSPEIMGWHAATMVIACLYLIGRRPVWLPLWAAGATWGLGCVLLSGRRKMFLVILTFLVIFGLLSQGWRRSRLLLAVLIASVVVIPILGVMVEDRYIETANTGLTSAGARITGSALSGPLWLLGIVGLFGYGVGTKTQGVQHLGVEIPSPLTEGGFEKIIVELGIAGTFAFLLFLYALTRCVITCSRRGRAAGLDQTWLAASAAFLVANAAAFVVAFQIYGDPFVVCIVGFVGGLLLSASRLADEKNRWLKRQLRVRQATEVAIPAGEVAV